MTRTGPPTPTPAPAGRLGGLGRLLAVIVALDASGSMVFALLADLRAEHGLDTWHLGLISASAFLANVTAQLTLAGLADRGRARLLMRLGLVLAVSGNLLFAFGDTVVVFVVGRLLGGLGSGAFFPAARAVAAARDPANLGQNLGRVAAANLVGFTVGPVVGTVLAELAGLRAPFLVAALVAGSSLALLGGLHIPDSLGATGTRERVLAVDLLRLRPVAIAAALAVALFVPIGMYDALWSQYLSDRGAGTTFVGISMAAYGIPFALLAPAGGRLADRVGPMRCALVGLAVSAPMTWAYGILALPWAIAAASIVEACVQAVTFPATQAAMARACPPGRLAAGQGLAGALQQLAAAAMALVAAPLYGATGSVVTFGVAAALVAVIGLGVAAAARWSTPVAVS
jgi:MFS family permease